jgi:formamidopyrimidine-DNA glycosylase
MPEGPEVKTVAVSLDAKIKNLYIIALEINHLSRYDKNPQLSDSLKKVDLPLKIIRVYSKGKKILFECVDINGQKIYLIFRILKLRLRTYRIQNLSGLPGYFR